MTAKLKKLEREGRLDKWTQDQTPAVYFNTPTHYLKLYAVRGGKEGIQFVGIAFDCENTPLYYKTRGYNYDKKEACLRALFEGIGYAPREVKQLMKKHLDTWRGVKKYHVGGNFYKVTKSNWVKL